MKAFLEKIRTQIGEINFFLSKIEIPGDAERVLIESRKNLQSAKTALHYFENNIIKEIREVEQEIRGNGSKIVDNKYSKYLKSVNSPSTLMMKNSESNMVIKKSVFTQNMIKGNENVKRSSANK